MKVFQTLNLGSHYLKYFNKKHTSSNVLTYQARKEAILADRHCSSHILKPMYESNPNCYLALGDDVITQRMWAKEKGLNSSSLEEILLTQIEEFQPDVLYMTDPIRFPSSFIKLLPSCVKISIAFWASLIGDIKANDILAYDLIVSNFKTLNNEVNDILGIKTAWFSPSWDPEMEVFSKNNERPVDLSFSGGYRGVSGVYGERIMALEAMAGLSESYQVEINLMSPRFSRLSSKGFYRWIPVFTKIPSSIKKLKSDPVYGREMLLKQSKAKIILNPHTDVDVAGKQRGNMRCWEALGCGACMVASEGVYPEGFVAGENFETYKDVSDLLTKINNLLSDDARRIEIAKKGIEMISTIWSKERQWEDFKNLINKNI